MPHDVVVAEALADRRCPVEIVLDPRAPLRVVAGCAFPVVDEVQPDDEQ